LQVKLRADTLFCKPIISGTDIVVATTKTEK
jgi:hypothetical protein